MNNYYVYIHRRKSDNKVFYVGKGKARRAYSPHGRNSHWTNTYKKHGLIVEIVFDNLNEKEALTLEKDVITEMRYHFESTLCNLTDGGEGVSGYKWTEEAMLKHPSKKLKGKSLSEQHRKNIGSSLVGHITHNHTRDKLSVSNKNTYIPVRVFNLMSRVLKGKPYVHLNYLEKITGIPAKQLYKKPKVKATLSALALQRSAEVRRGKPSWNSGKKCEQFSGKNNSSADLNCYKFIRNTDNTIFEGTRYQLCETFNLNLANIGKLFYKKNGRSSQGWSLLKD
jgi:hypothetical protein